MQEIARVFIKVSIGVPGFARANGVYQKKAVDPAKSTHAMENDKVLADKFGKSHIPSGKLT